jgi:hypothetical protein
MLCSTSRFEHQLGPAADIFYITLAPPSLTPPNDPVIRPSVRASRLVVDDCVRLDADPPRPRAAGDNLGPAFTPSLTTPDLQAIRDALNAPDAIAVIDAEIENIHCFKKVSSTPMTKFPLAQICTVCTWVTFGS